jgi:hypothetical protein
MTGFGAAEASAQKRKNILERPSEPPPLAGPVTLASVNERWAGAVGQTRVMIPIQKRAGSDGWSSSDWMVAAGHPLRMRFSVSDREALREVLPQKNLLQGVRLVCERWTVQNPKKGRGIQVDFRFQNYPARARAEFNTDLEHLSDVERFLEANVMVVSGLGELEPAVAGPTASEVAESATGERRLEIESAHVQPAVTRAGEQVELVIEYSISGGGAGPTEVRERRIVAKAMEELASFESLAERRPGAHTSVQSVRIPAGTAPGFYSFKAEVSLGELSDDYTVLFEVQ